MVLGQKVKVYFRKIKPFLKKATPAKSDLQPTFTTEVTAPQINIIFVASKNYKLFFLIMQEIFKEEKSNFAVGKWHTVFINVDMLDGSVIFVFQNEFGQYSGTFG